MEGGQEKRDWREDVLELLLLTAAVLIAVLSARSHAGSWNDGSRLATVEALVDHCTLAIDRSVFVEVPQPGGPLPCPYRDVEQGLTRIGTCDKLYVKGHFYSDKSPVPALWLAGWYHLWQAATGWTARYQPAPFCRAMTLLSSGLAYVAALLCLFRLGRRLALSLQLRLGLTASLALATTALPYAQYVNNHILLLAVYMALVLNVAGLAREVEAGRVCLRRVAMLGTLAGIGYTIDLGVGPVFLAGTGALVLLRCRRWLPFIVFIATAMPWLLLHHALNYYVGGTLRPANTVVEYFAWPGCPFQHGNLTGHWIHPGPGSFALYAASMLFGKRGFFGHNLPLFLLLPALAALARRSCREWPEVLWAGACCAGTWLLYAATSNNSSGQCCSIRWFVPLLAPAYYVLALFLRRFPDWQKVFLVLSAWGALLVVFGMADGPWMKRMVPHFWPVQALALLSWLACRSRRVATWKLTSGLPASLTPHLLGAPGAPSGSPAATGARALPTLEINGLERTLKVEAQRMGRSFARIVQHQHRCHTNG
jgi:hypothetical protein